jgi:iron complex transport system substrate-binding protein
MYCHYPPEAAKKPKIGGYTQPDLETIAALRPDLVIIQKNPIRLAERLQSLKLNVLEVSHDSIAEIGRTIALIGQAAGVPERAESLNASIRAQLDEVRKRAARFPPRKTFFVIGRTPGTIQNLVTLSAGSYLDEIIRIAGGINVFADARTSYPKVTLEEVLARAPEVIIDMGDMAQTVGVTEEHKRSVVKLWSRHPSLPAVKQGRVYAVASDVFVVPGPRVVEAAREFARLIHPEAR